MKTYEKNDINSAKKKFAGNYIVIMVIILLISNIFNHMESISINGITAIRSIALFVAILVSARVLTKSVIKKFQITKSNADNLRFNINLIVIGIAIISLFYFLFSVHSNVKEMKNTTSYRVLSIYSTQEEADKIVEDAASKARKSFLIVWVAIMISSAIVVGTDGKYIEELCFPDVTNESINGTERMKEKIIQ